MRPLTKVTFSPTDPMSDICISNTERAEDGGFFSRVKLNGEEERIVSDPTLPHLREKLWWLMELAR